MFITNDFGNISVSLNLLKNPSTDSTLDEVKQFCTEFCHSESQPKYILGRNIYAECVAGQVNLSGFIDDYTNDKNYLGLSIVKLDDVPKNALVLNVAGGRPLSASKRLSEAGLRNLDYFSFYRFSGLSLIEMRFNEGFSEEYSDHQEQYRWIHDLLQDQNSREIFNKLVSFRLEYDLAYLEGFVSKEDTQYFEDFLHLDVNGETFIDVGGYDGFTSLAFIKRAQNYKAIHVFEPEPNNYQKCLNNLSAYRDTYVHHLALSRSSATMKIHAQGSGSKISGDGTVTVSAVRLDDVLTDMDVPTFIKMDIEGEEFSAIEGARNTILTHHPRLAISVYHRPGDFWRIPKLILSIRDDYELYMRHYTECIYETVMFFVPKK